MPVLQVGKLVLALLPKPKEGWSLSMDRTNWQLGQSHINMLTVGVVLRGMAFPIAWKTLPARTKDGNSCSDHRIAIIKKVLKLIPADQIHSLLMDREFIEEALDGWTGRTLLRWYESAQYHYREE